MDEHYNTWDEKSYESEDSTPSGASTVVYEQRWHDAQPEEKMGNWEKVLTVEVQQRGGEALPYYI